MSASDNCHDGRRNTRYYDRSRYYNGGYGGYYGGGYNGYYGGGYNNYYRPRSGISISIGSGGGYYGGQPYYRRW